MATIKELGIKVGDFRTVSINGQTGSGKVVEMDEEHVYLAGLNFGRVVDRPVQNGGGTVKLRAFDAWADIFRAKGLTDWGKIVFHRLHLDRVTDFVGKVSRGGERD